MPVDFIYDAINPTFLLWMAKIGAYAADKYGSWEQYTRARLTGEKSPLNHVQEHLRQYRLGEPYDHFDGDLRWHLVAGAYNFMMEFYYHTRWGHSRHPLTIEKPETVAPPTHGDSVTVLGAFLPGSIAQLVHTPDGWVVTENAQ
jgi:hypothetical protein